MAYNRDRTTERAAAWAQAMAASPPIQELVAVARQALDEGIDELAVHARVKEWMEAKDLASWRFFLPGINRKVARYPFPKMLIEVAKFYAKSTRHKTVRDFIESFTARVGWDEWLVDNAVSLARTGEPTPVLGSLFGGVHVQRMTFGDEPAEIVMLVAGPASDFQALADEFLATCSRIYPESWERSATELRDARWVRAFYENADDAEIAWGELERLHPGEIVHENPKFAAEHKRKVQQIKQARKRWLDRVTKILDSASPDSETR